MEKVRIVMFGGPQDGAEHNVSAPAPNHLMSCGWIYEYVGTNDGVRHYRVLKAEPAAA